MSKYDELSGPARKAVLVREIMDFAMAAFESFEPDDLAIDLVYLMRAVVNGITFDEWEDHPSVLLTAMRERGRFPKDHVVWKSVVRRKE